MASMTDEETYTFIGLYGAENCLWDPNNKHHKTKNIVNESWQRIANKMGLPVHELKKKKECLMCTFRINLKKKALFKSDGEDEFKPNWKFYDALEAFLGDVYEIKSPLKSEKNFFNNTETFTHSHELNDPISVRNASVPDKNSTSYKKTRFKPCSNKNRYKNQIDDTTTHSRDSSDVSHNTLDEYDLYGQLLAKKLRKLDEHQRDVAMHEIDNIMFRVKMQSGSTSQNRNYSTSPSPTPRKTKSPVFIITQQSHAQYEDENINSYTEHNTPTS